ncbi:MAG: hypothetical protein V9H69_16145 [Anaerolineae bacterium]|jgi:hypothetical protein
MKEFDLNQNDAPLTCVNCGQPETSAPVVALRFNGSQAWICSMCLPVLIHQPQRLIGKLAGAETIQPGRH